MSCSKVKWGNSRKVTTTLPGIYCKLKDAGYNFGPVHNALITINGTMVPCCYNVTPTCFHSLSWYLPRLPALQFLMFTGKLEQDSGPIGMRGPESCTKSTSWTYLNKHILGWWWPQFVPILKPPAFLTSFSLSISYTSNSHRASLISNQRDEHLQPQEGKFSI